MWFESILTIIHMKKKNAILYALPLLLLAGCGSSDNKSVGESDSVAESEIIEAVEAVRKANFITKDSVGGIMVGASVNTIPESIPGLYTSRQHGASQDAVTVSFSDDSGEQFVVYDFGEGKIDVINVVGPAIKVDALDGVFGIGDSFANVLSIPGVQAEWIGYDDGGMWYWTWDGLWFAPSQQGLGEILSRKLYDSKETPSAADFSDDVKVGFIGTGLPF